MKKQITKSQHKIFSCIFCILIFIISCDFKSSKFILPIGYNSSSQKETDSIIYNSTINFSTVKPFKTFLGFKLNSSESFNIERYKKRENSGKIIISKKIQPFNVRFFEFGGLTDIIVFDISSIYDYGTTEFWPISTKSDIVNRAKIINQLAKKNNANNKYEDVKYTFDSLKESCLKSYGNYNIYENDQNTTGKFYKNSSSTFERFHWIVGEIHITLSTGSHQKIVNDTILKKIEIKSVLYYTSLQYKSTVQERRKATFEYDKIRLQREKLEEFETKQKITIDSIEEINTNQNRDKIMNEF